MPIQQRVTAKGKKSTPDTSHHNRTPTPAGLTLSSSPAISCLVAFGGYRDTQEEDVGMEREDKNQRSLMETKYDISNSSWGLLEIAGKIESTSQRSEVKGRKASKKMCFSSHRIDFHPVQLIYFGTKILLVPEKVYRVNFIILRF